MESERLARLEEQGKWIANKVDRIEIKMDDLLAFKWKVLGASMIAAFLASLLIETARAFF